MQRLRSNLTKYLFTFGFLIVFLALLSFLVKNKSEVSIMTITSFGELTVIPNEVILNFSLESSSDDYNKVVDLDINSYNSILSSLVSGLGINEQDVKTSSYSLNPKYAYKDGNRVFEGFALYHSYQLSSIYDSKNFQNLVQVLKTVKVEASTKFNFSLEFANSEIEKYENEAYNTAIKLAEKKAKVIASSSGVTIIGKINILPLDNNVSTYAASPRMSLAMDVSGYNNFTPNEIKINKGIPNCFSNKVV